MRTLIAVMAAVSVTLVAARFQEKSLEERVTRLEAQARFMESLHVKEIAEAKIITTRTNLNQFQSALGMYEIDNGVYPTTEQGLKALVEKPAAAGAKWHQTLYKIENDPWGTPYFYKCPGVKNPDNFDLYSAGPDGKDGTADDIWPEKK